MVHFAVATARRDGGRGLRVSLSVYGPDIRGEVAVVNDDGASLRGHGSGGGSDGRDSGGNFHRSCGL